ncbi:MAG: hypothetical protein OMM_03026 [Candidatus Magnetoglobus multicellularis str. Araruama]|uniref:Bacterial membrane protein YfhO n=1 Tax=Candidatus Magnetoglobus multicellularis str. Araruama TaxID=890399 RepID=A0A1V1P7H0_9BACT|nr:MAG: hypothetical protein OMM_03026 [Candidatus Magnetoglobus multicellularis str. Araruama]
MAFVRGRSHFIRTSAFMEPIFKYGASLYGQSRVCDFISISFLFLCLPPVLAMKVSIIFHLFISGLFMYWLCRFLFMQNRSALFVAVAWVFNTYIITRIEFHSVLTTITWMPLVILQGEKIKRIVTENCHVSVIQIIQCTKKDLIILIISLVMQFLAGNPQPMLFTIFALIGYILLPGIIHRNIRYISIQLLLLSLAGFFSLCLVLPQLALTWELIPFSIRAHEIDPGGMNGSVHPFCLITGILPYFFGIPGYFGNWLGQEWTLIEYWQSSCYIGIPTLVLITYSFQYVKKIYSETVLYLWIIGIIGMIISFGFHTPIYTFLYKYLPLFDKLRWPGKALCIPVFCFCLLSGYGYQLLMDRYHGCAHTGLFMWTFILIVTLALYIDVNTFNFFSQWTGFFDANHYVSELRKTDLAYMIVYLGGSIMIIAVMRFSSIRPIVSVCLTVLLFINLYQVSGKILTYGDDTLYTATPVTEVENIKENGYRLHSTYDISQRWLYGLKNPEIFKWAVDACVGETWLPLNVRKTWGGGALRLAYVAKYHAVLRNETTQKVNRMADVLNIGYVIHGPPLKTVLKQQRRWPIKLLKRDTALPRAFFVSRWRPISDWQVALPYLLSSDFNPHAQALIRTNNPNEIPLPKIQFHHNLVIDLSDDWNQTNIEIQCSGFALLVLNDPWYPGWKAFIDGKQQPIYQVNGIFRGLFVRPGSHRIRFLYQPDYLVFCFGVSLLVMFLLLFVWWVNPTTINQKNTMDSNH